MARGKQRDEEFVAFVRDAQLRLRRTAYLMCGDWQRAEDVVQTALVKLYAHWERVDRQQGAWSYARRTVVNTAIDESRRPWRREVATEFLPDSGVGAPAGFDDALLDGLTALPPRQRAVVVLRYVEDLEVETVAQMLDISTGTVKSQAARGLDTLRARLSAAPSALRPTGTEIR
ncbi:MAG: SigE family RNA polymerase sigma factor [Sporichthyaceae bacterium]